MRDLVSVLSSDSVTTLLLSGWERGPKPAPKAMERAAERNKHPAQVEIFLA